MRASKGEERVMNHRNQRQKNLKSNIFTTTGVDSKVSFNTWSNVSTFQENFWNFQSITLTKLIPASLVQQSLPSANSLSSLDGQEIRSRHIRCIYSIPVNKNWVDGALVQLHQCLLHIQQWKINCHLAGYGFCSDPFLTQQIKFQELIFSHYLPITSLHSLQTHI